MRSPVNVISPKQFEIETSEDEQISQKLLKQKIEEVKKVYRRDLMIENHTDLVLMNFFVGFKDDRKFKMVSENITDKLKIQPRTINFLLKQDRDSLSFIEFISQQLVKNIYAEGIISTEDIKTVIMDKFKEVDLDRKYQNAILDILSAAINPNMIFSEVDTLSKMEEVKRSFIPQSTIIKKGQPIVYRNDIISPLTLEILEKTGLYRKQMQWGKFLTVVLSIVFLVIVLESRMTYYVGPSNKQLFLMFSLESVYFLIIYALLLYDRFPEYLAGAYLIPVVYFTFLFSFLIYEKLSLHLSQFNAILVLLLFNANPQAALYILITTMVTNIFIKYFKKRRDLPLVGVIIGVLAAFIVMIIELNVSHSPYKIVLIHMIQVFFNSVISIILAIGTVPYLEEIFDITTDLKLLDYGDLNNQLMRHMLSEAPGTYYHSLMVSNLAEAAAEEIGANSILARVAAYYHDIGKLKKPEYFIENISHGINPHDAAMPTLSALKILGHPRDGLEIAKKNKLPREIQNIIVEHHGTGLLVYFYHKMLKITMNDVVDESQFRYDCPKPSSKESGIIMLADSVEAAVRTLDKPSPAKIMALIDKIVKDKLEDGQLDCSNLSLSDIERVKLVFFNVTASQYHARIKYPEAKEKASDEKGS
ncbi:MAG: HDIG domain-containing protein [Candidatus Margulisbacteria bacterium]|nr:HDIG domain-containing protein [Candidatus Margulisiibacteriota bacterium]